MKRNIIEGPWRTLTVPLRAALIIGIVQSACNVPPQSRSNGETITLAPPPPTLEVPPPDLLPTVAFPAHLISTEVPTIELLPTVTLPVDPLGPVPSETEPLPETGTDMYVFPNSQLALAATQLETTDPETAAKLKEMAAQPMGIWLGEWSVDVQTFVANILSDAGSANKVPLLITYWAPIRDAGQFSAGGAESSSQYLDWILKLAAGIKDGKALVVLEPDMLPLTEGMEEDVRNVQIATMRNAVTILHEQTNATIMVDIGHSGWLSSQRAAELLIEAGIENAEGFSVNISNFRSTEEVVIWAEEVSSLVSGKQYIVDTSRNGNGPAPDGEWCNPAGRGLGEPPTANHVRPNAPHLLTTVYAKNPGESDGDCNGHPPAGTFSPQLAVDLYDESPFFGHTP